MLRIHADSNCIVLSSDLPIGNSQELRDLVESAFLEHGISKVLGNLIYKGNTYYFERSHSDWFKQLDQEHVAVFYAPQPDAVEIKIAEFSIIITSNISLTDPEVYRSIIAKKVRELGFMWASDVLVGKTGRFASFNDVYTHLARHGLVCLWKQ